MPEKKTRSQKSNVKSKKAAVKTTKTVVKKAVLTKKDSGMQSGLKLDVLNTSGEKEGQITLPESIFGAKINPKLISQAVRVYLTNQRQGTVSTKTRGEVDGSTRKIYRQKGTGRARHGGIRAPIFVKGGIAHGPKPKNYELHLPKKMKRAALFSALSAKVKDKELKVVSGVESLEAKTKAFAKAFDKWGLMQKGRNALLVLPQDMENIYKSARNLAGVTVTTANRLNTYDILQHKAVVVMKDAVNSIEKVFGKKEEK